MLNPKISAREALSLGLINRVVPDAALREETRKMALEVAERGANSFDASRNTYKRLVTPGITALVTNVVGFGTILLIPVGIIREMAINAMFGLLAVIVCKKILLPCLLSYAHLGDPNKFRDYQRKRDAREQDVAARLQGLAARVASMEQEALGFAVAEPQADDRQPAVDFQPQGGGRTARLRGRRAVDDAGIGVVGLGTPAAAGRGVDDAGQHLGVHAPDMMRHCLGEEL